MGAMIGEGTINFELDHCWFKLSLGYSDFMPILESSGGGFRALFLPVGSSPMQIYSRSELYIPVFFL